MSNSKEESRPRRPSARRSVRPGKPRVQAPVGEPQAEGPTASSVRVTRSSKGTRAAGRVAGRPGKRSRAPSPGEAHARVFEGGPDRGETREDLEIDAALASRMAPVLELLYRRYFQVRALGLEKIPSSGCVVLACNHEGPLSWDGVILKTAMQVENCARQNPRWLVQKALLRLPFLGAFLRRIGAVPACREKAERVLSRGEVLAVFPEDLGDGDAMGDGGDARERLSSTAYVELALRAGAPLLPVAMVSAEDSYPLLDRVKELPGLRGFSFPPFRQRLLWPDPLGLLPLPGRWRIVVGEPIEELKGRASGDADDPLFVRRIDEQVRYIVKELFYVARAALQGA
jgi:1-acyl-sn-glycerol-3-phosphate acyltransferase